MKKILDKKRDENLVDESINAVTRVLGENEISEEGMMAATPRQSKRTVYDIPIDQIQPRAINDYSIRGIEELAGSIEKIGLQQPVIVRQNPGEGKKYILVAGERRYNAMLYNQHKFEKECDYVKAKLFTTIDAIILSDEEMENEKAIYADTNDYSRQITNYERILRMEPDAIDMQKESWQKKYVEKIYGPEKLEDFDSGKLKLKGNINEKCQYIVKCLLEKEPDLDISEKTVRNYLAFISRTCDTLRMAILKGTISLRDARELSWLPVNDQISAVDAALSSDTETYTSLLAKSQEYQSAGANSQRITEEEKFDRDYQKITKSLISTKKKFEKLDEEIANKRFTTKFQKDYIKKLRQIIKDISILEDMPME